MKRCDRVVTSFVITCSLFSVVGCAQESAMYSRNEADGSHAVTATVGSAGHSRTTPAEQGAVTSSRQRPAAFLQRSGVEWSRSGPRSISVKGPDGALTVNPPVKLTSGSSVGWVGKGLVAATVRNGTLTIERSNDNGVTWKKKELKIPTGMQYPVVSSARHGGTFVAALDGGSASGARPSSVGYVFSTHSSLRRIRIPGAAQDLAVTSTVMIVPGGPANSHLYSSVNGGKSWTDVSVAVRGIVPPTSDVAPTTPIFQTVIPLNNGSLAVPIVQSDATGSLTIALYTTLDGARFSQLVKRGPFTSNAEPPVSLVLGSAGTGGVVLVIPGSTTFALIKSDGTVMMIQSSGLPGSPDAISFQSPKVGSAQTTVTHCNPDKSGCVTNVTQYATSDGAKTWTVT